MLKSHSTSYSYNGTSYFLKEDSFKIPTLCPRCKTTISPDRISSILNDQNSVQIVFFCKACNKLFLANYSSTYETVNGDKGIACNNFLNTEPLEYEEHIFSESINKTSSNFSLIYNQSLQAESLKLDQIAGIGYRKALEFLVKDYIINHLQGDEAEIKAKPIMQCIKTYITHPQTLEVLETAVWIGNDESHYVRKYSNSDIDMLKHLIDLSILWIRLDIESSSAKSNLTSSE